jgi:3-deoxy-D-manno-octulosonic-acid transferase
MNRILYNIFLHTLAAPLLTAYYGPQVILGQKYRRSIRGKLGRLPEDFVPEQLPRPRVWFHAVSVGEVNALTPLVRALREIEPGAATLVSTGTETGQDTARSSIPRADGLFYLPLDFPTLVNTVVDRIRPDLFVLMETELWPNLIHTLKKTGARVILANGRISDRSYPRYKKLRWFFSDLLQQIDLFLMVSQLDASRISAMGAPENRIRVTGNTKFDAAIVKIPNGIEAKMRQMLGLQGSGQVVVAGSTHTGEHEIVLSAYSELTKKFPDLVLVLVPRHAERTPQIVAFMKDRSLPTPFLRSSIDRGEPRDGRQIIVWDQVGELFEVFSLASVVFMGGSLVPKGGQNILEPASWGKVVLFGPSMEPFRDAKEILLHSGGGIQVSGQDELIQRLVELLSDPARAMLLGAGGRDEIARHTGSAARNAELLSGQIRATENR